MTTTATARTILSYQEALERIEAFMVDSGIRQFCSEVCHGECCREIACQQKIQPGEQCRKINCVAFVCHHQIKSRLKQRDRVYLELLRDHCLHVICVAGRELNDGTNYNLYGHDYSEALRQRCRFDAVIVEEGIPPAESWPEIAAQFDKLR